jgi:hypothetical protein
LTPFNRKSMESVPPLIQKISVYIRLRGVRVTAESKLTGVCLMFTQKKPCNVVNIVESKCSSVSTESKLSNLNISANSKPFEKLLQELRKETRHNFYELRSQRSIICETIPLNSKDVPLVSGRVKIIPYALPVL